MKGTLPKIINTLAIISILGFSKKPIELFNRGNHERDFTYIDNVIDPIYKLLKRKPGYPSTFYLSM